VLVEEKTPLEVLPVYARQHTNSRLGQQTAHLKTVSGGQQVVHHLHSHKGMLCNLFIILKLGIIGNMALLLKILEFFLI
jgi:hypothetical protein